MSCAKINASRRFPKRLDGSKVNRTHHVDECLELQIIEEQKLAEKMEEEKLKQKGGLR